VFVARAGLLVVAGAVLGAFSGGCVNLSYPPGAARDGGAASPRQQANGTECHAAGDCRSGFCRDNVCCMTSCDGPCLTCAKGSQGLCTFADLNTNSRGMCTDSGASQCGQTGVCDGAGACQIYPAGTSCKDAGCPGLLLVLASRCDGNGTCVAGQTQSCSPFLCGVDGKCLAACKSDVDCENGHHCMMMMTGDGGTPTGICGMKALGTQCAADDECDSTHCAQGVCCSVACNGGCQSCALKGNEGACTPVPAGMPSVPVVVASATSTACQATDVSTCGLDGTCDGAGACRLFPAGTACSVSSCASAMLRNANTCDGKNHCQPAAAVTCGGYTCATATTCKTMCGADTDCAAPSVCNLAESACGGLTAQYFRQTNLTDLALSRVDPQINFTWGQMDPNPLLNQGNFSVRWTGKITARFNEPYTFIALTDDGERLWINDQLIIDRFVRKPSIPEDDSPAVMMNAGQPVDIKLEYFQSGGDASAQLLWQSKSETRAVIPTSALAPQ
jgi:hypothetical protein